MEKRKFLKIVYFCCILLAIIIMIVPGIYIVRWMSPPDEPDALWLTLHSYLDIRLLGMSHFFPLITGFTAILCVLCHIGFKETNKIVFTLTIISLFASICSISSSYSINIAGIVITSLLFLSLICQFIYKRTN